MLAILYASDCLDISQLFFLVLSSDASEGEDLISGKGTGSRALSHQHIVISFSSVDIMSIQK